MSAPAPAPKRAHRRGTADRVDGAHWIRDTQLAAELGISGRWSTSSVSRACPRWPSDDPRRYNLAECVDWLREVES